MIYFIAALRGRPMGTLPSSPERLAMVGNYESVAEFEMLGRPAIRSWSLVSVEHTDGRTEIRLADLDFVGHTVWNVSARREKFLGDQFDGSERKRFSRFRQQIASLGRLSQVRPGSEIETAVYRKLGRDRVSRDNVRCALEDTLRLGAVS